MILYSDYLNNMVNVEYLESSGTQKIDIGIRMPVVTRVIIDASCVSQSELFGTRNGNSSIRFHIGVSQNE